MAHQHTVLVVDDEAAVRDLFSDVLRSTGCQVAAARGGEEAVRLLAEGLDPCMVLADVRMPNMDGWDLHRTLQRDAPGLPVLLLTGDRLLSVAAPVRSKPYAPDEIEALVRNFCRARDGERSAAAAGVGEPA